MYGYLTSSQIQDHLNDLQKKQPAESHKLGLFVKFAGDILYVEVYAVKMDELWFINGKNLKGLLIRNTNKQIYGVICNIKKNEFVGMFTSQYKDNFQQVFIPSPKVLGTTFNFSEPLLTKRKIKFGGSTAESVIRQDAQNTTELFLTRSQKFFKILIIITSNDGEVVFKDNL